MCGHTFFPSILSPSPVAFVSLTARGVVSRLGVSTRKESRYTQQHNPRRCIPLAHITNTSFNAIWSLMFVIESIVRGHRKMQENASDRQKKKGSYGQPIDVVNYIRWRALSCPREIAVMTNFVRARARAFIPRRDGHQEKR